MQTAQTHTRTQIHTYICIYICMSICRYRLHTLSISISLSLTHRNLLDRFNSHLSGYMRELHVGHSNYVDRICSKNRNR